MPPDALDRLITHLAQTYDLDPVGVAEALWLWTAPGGPGPAAEPDAAGQHRAQRSRGPDAHPDGADEDGDAGDRMLPLYGGDGDATHGPSGSPAFPYRVRASLDTLSLGRALRPFRRRWPDGRRTELDVPATVDGYAASGSVVPYFRPASERWFDVEVVVDGAASMEVWADATEQFGTLLAGLGVFRAVRRWSLGADGGLRAPDGRVMSGRALHAPDGRRLVVVLSDCAAPWWRTPRPWLRLREWAGNTPTVLINPLPTTAWRRTALDLPTARLTTTVPGGFGRDLRPAGWASPGAVTALPIPALDPYALGRWARALMNTDPDGCDGALVPAGGRAPEPDGAEPDDEDWPPPSPVEALRLSASPRALRLAVLCALQDDDALKMSYLHLLRRELVPEADADDLAAVLTGGLLDPVPTGGEPLLRFRPGVRERLRSLQTPTDAWQRYQTISRHAATQAGSGGRFTVLVPEDDGALSLPPTGTPIGEAPESALRQVGLITRETPPSLSGDAIVTPRPEAPAPAPDDDPAAPVFVLSHARTRSDRDRPERRLFDRLAVHISELVYLAPGRDAGFLDSAPAGGDRWPFLDTLGRCHVMVGLVSEPYLNSAWCSREWDLMTRRTVRDRESGEPAGNVMIVPVVWAPLRSPLPPAVASIQRFMPGGPQAEDIGRRYLEDGLLGLLRAGREGEFDLVVWRLAMQITSLYYRYRAEPLQLSNADDLDPTFGRREP
ncbi:SAV_2336 N-terminal domain-related protein [Dactylosporangium sp. NPDC049140]|uniref:SAV_2336 N-terminal domain-related protein n=1 Tax=Dactylosporangium sp. NPDC049140 TaxID=3155647 RepID=UPI0033ED9CF0